MAHDDVLAQNTHALNRLAAALERLATVAERSARRIQDPQGPEMEATDADDGTD